MIYVLLAEHTADLCPTANAKVRALMMETSPTISKLAEQSGVKIVAGPYVNREHISVVVVEADKGEDLDKFIVASRLNQWNSVRVLPSYPITEVIKEIEEQPVLF